MHGRLKKHKGQHFDSALTQHVSCCPPEKPCAGSDPTGLTELVGKLLTQDGHGGADALEDGGSEGGADGQTVDEVVQAVAQRDHPGQSPDVRVGRSFQPIAGGATLSGPGATVWTLGLLRTRTLYPAACEGI